MAGYMASVRKAKNYAEFKKMHPKVDLTREGFLDLKRRGSPPRSISDEDRSLAELFEAKFLNRNDGGVARKTLMAENISDFERAALRDGRQISDKERARARAMAAKFKAKRAKEISEGRQISDADRARAREEKYMKRNDGGRAKKTRIF